MQLPARIGLTAAGSIENTVLGLGYGVEQSRIDSSASCLGGRIGTSNEGKESSAVGGVGVGIVILLDAATIAGSCRGSAHCF